ncbi:MAG: hypothetical protein AAF267_11650 [Deinococcota bacterium]
MRYAGLRLRHVIIGMGFLFYVTNVQQLSAFSIVVMVIFLGLSFFLFGCYADDDMGSVWLLIGAYLAVAIVITASAQSHKSMLFWAVLSCGFLDIYLEDTARWFTIVPCGMAASAALYYALPPAQASLIYFVGNYVTFVVLHFVFMRRKFSIFALWVSTFMALHWLLWIIGVLTDDVNSVYDTVYYTFPLFGLWFRVCQVFRLPFFGPSNLSKKSSQS